MATFSFHHRRSENPDVDSVGAVEALADLSGVDILRQGSVESRDGDLVELYAECKNDDDCAKYIKALRTLGLLY